MRKKLGLFWFAAALLGAALIFAGCETEADEKIVYLPGEMIHLDVVVANVADLAKALEDDEVLAVGFDGNDTDGNNPLTVGLEVKDGKAIYILNGGTLKTAGSNANLTVKGIVYVGIGGKLDTSAGTVIVDGGQVSVLPAKSVAAITAGVPPGTLVIASDASVTDKEGTTALKTDKVWIGGALELVGTAPTVALINAAFTYVQPGGAVKVGTDSTVAATETVTVPEGKSLNVAAALNLDAGAELVATGDVNVVVTSGSLVLAGTVGTAVAKISGAGNIVAGATTITGTWQLAGTAGSVAIEATSGTSSIITASGTSAVLTAGTGGVITQAAVGSNSLTIAGSTTIALGGVFATPVGTIVLTGDATNPAVLTLKGTITGDTSLTTAVGTGSIAITNAILTGAGSIAGSAGANSNLGLLIGSESANTITAGTSNVTLNSSATIKS
jgi:hypothetical protein